VRASPATGVSPRQAPRAPAEALATVADHVRTSYPRTNSASR